MKDIAIRTVGLGKMYHIGGERQAYRTLRDTLMRAAMRPIERIRHPGAATHSSQELWALRDIDLEVERGEVLGIIGPNGSGKSTLLKILSHITEPSEGRAEIHGRVGSLLEVGTGFHGELTGRENIQLNGAILGMTRAEIRRKFDDIVEFSEIGRFLDTPVKRYSSGMYVRLAFAVAAHMDPDILIVDEVLAVGDVQFQKKCMGKMDDVAQTGRTVLLVSHNMTAVLNLCRNGLLLDRGRAVKSGNARDVVDQYLAAAVGLGGAADVPEDSAHRWAHMEPLIRRVTLSSGSDPGGHTGLVRCGDEITVEVYCETNGRRIDYCLVGICSMQGERLLSLASDHDPTFDGSLSGSGRFICRLPSLPLAEGDYTVLAAVGTLAPERDLDVVEGVLRFHVTLADYFGTGAELGPGQGTFVQRSRWEIAPDS
jgi:lipopolysaccharide transport system ATP-binding protein